MIHQFAYYSIAYNEGAYFLIPEPCQCPTRRNCADEVYWGYANASTLNGGQGIIFPSKTLCINPFMQELTFEYRTGIYSKMTISFFEPNSDNSKKHIITILPEFIEPNIFNDPESAINYIFPFLEKLVKCQRLEDIYELFGL